LLKLGIEIAQATVGRPPGAGEPFCAITLLTSRRSICSSFRRVDEAQLERRRIRTLRPNYSFNDFKEAFHLQDDLETIYQRAAKLVQIPER
jgi:hypothetical protein